MPRSAMCLWLAASVYVLACGSTSPDHRSPAAPPASTSRAAPPAPAASPPPASAHDAAAPAPRPRAAPVATSAAATCPPKLQPKACPAAEPNINHPCSPKGMECTYAAGCCPPVYVCNKTGHFEAHFTRCD